MFPWVDTPEHEAHMAFSSSLRVPSAVCSAVWSQHNPRRIGQGCLKSLEYFEMLVLFCFLRLFFASSPSERVLTCPVYLQGPVQPCRERSVADRDLLGCFQKTREGEEESVSICQEEQTKIFRSFLFTESHIWRLTHCNVSAPPPPPDILKTVCVSYNKREHNVFSSVWPGRDALDLGHIQ